MKMFCSTTVVTVAQLYIFVTIHQIVHLKLAHFLGYKLHLYKVTKQGTKRTLSLSAGSTLLSLVQAIPLP